MTPYPYPEKKNAFLEVHIHRLRASLLKWCARDLVPPGTKPRDRARKVFHAPFVVVSHDNSPDPVFNYGNLTALNLFETTWEEWTNLPSRKSAEPVYQDERERLLRQVTLRGYIEDYSGIRITGKGRRFFIRRALVWNVLDEQGNVSGQAATFDEWSFLD